jgi:hypothetical protein
VVVIQKVAASVVAVGVARGLVSRVRTKPVPACSPSIEPCEDILREWDSCLRALVES